MRYLVAILVAWFLAVVNVSVMSYVHVLGVHPDLVVIFAGCWATRRGFEEALLVVPVAGLLHDLSTSDPLGTSMLALMPTVGLAAFVRLRAVDSQFVPALVVVSFGSLAYSLISMMVLASTGQAIAWADALLRVALPLAVVNPLLAPLIYLPIHRLSPGPQPAILGRGRITSPL